MKTRTEKARRLKFQSLESRYALSATPLVNGEEVRREVGQEDPFDDFYFDAQDGDYVWVSVGEERAKTGNTVQLSIRSPSGRVWTDYDSNSAQSIFQATESGRYDVYVSERGNERDFDYNLRLVVLPGAIAPRYGQDAFLEPGDRHTATLEFGRLSVVQFDAAAGATVFTSLGRTSGAAEPQVSIVDPAGDLVHSNWGYTAVTGEFVATVDGVYTAVIGDRYGDEWLPFTFSVASLPGEVDYDRPENTYLLSGERHESSIPVGQQHLVQFDASAGDRVYASLGEVSSQAGDPRIRVLDPDGTLVPNTSVWDYAGLQVGFEAPKTGLYTAVLGDRGADNPLDYTFSLAVLGGAVDYALPQNTRLESGERHTGSIAVGEQHLVQFDASVGSTVAISLGEVESSAGDPQVWVVSPSGVVVPNTYQWSYDGLLLNFEATEDGLYTAVVTERHIDNALDYTFSVAVLGGAVDDSLPQNTHLENGERHTGSIGVGEQHLVQFEAEAGATAIVSLGETSDQSAEPQVWVIGPDGQYVDNTYAWDYDGLLTGFEAPSTGLYTAIVTDRGGNSPLDYRVRVASLPAGGSDRQRLEPVLQEGVARAGALEPGDFAVHPFYVGPDGNASVTLTETSGDSTGVSLEVFDSQGQGVRYSWGYTEAAVQLTSLAQGWHYALVAERQANQELGYSIAATGVGAPPALPGDANNDGTVDLLDLDVLGANFGSTPATAAQGDFNGDNVVDLLDLDILGSRFGTTAAASASNSAALAFATPTRSADANGPSSPRAARSTSPASAADEAALLLFALDPTVEDEPDSSDSSPAYSAVSQTGGLEELDSAFAGAW